jgi:hypothetical protein
VEHNLIGTTDEFLRSDTIDLIAVAGLLGWQGLPDQIQIGAVRRR